MTSAEDFGLNSTPPTRRPYVGWLCGGVLLAIVLAVVLAPALAPHSPTALVDQPNLAPSHRYWLGTDELGRDVLSRLLYGGRIPLLSAMASMVVAGVVGTSLGMIAGTARAAVSSLIMRFIDVMLAFPTLIVGFVVVAILGRGNAQVTVAVAISFVPIYTRIVYTSTLSVRAEDYILASRSLGLSMTKILFGHILPNIRSEVVVLSSSVFGWSLLLDATFSFLGMGTAPPQADWGADLAAGRDVLYQAGWVSAAPGAVLALTILTANLFGDELSQGAQMSSRRWRRLVTRAWRVGMTPKEAVA